LLRGGAPGHGATDGGMHGRAHGVNTVVEHVEHAGAPASFLPRSTIGPAPVPTLHIVSEADAPQPVPSTMRMGASMSPLL